MQRESFFKSTKPLQTYDPATVQPLLEYCIGESEADAAYLYRAAQPAGPVELIARTGVSTLQVLEYESAGAFPQRRLIVSESAWSDPRFFPFPEIVVDRIESVALMPIGAQSVPKAGADALHGLAALAVGRCRAAPFDTRHIGIFETIAFALTAVLQGLRQAEELARLRAELERTHEKLAGRKAIERAKGIIQVRYACTEDEAYGHLRRLSRTTRERISEIARRVIQRSGPAAEDRKRLLA